MIKTGELFLGLRIAAVGVDDLGSDSLAMMLRDQLLKPFHLGAERDSRVETTAPVRYASTGTNP